MTDNNTDQAISTFFHGKSIFITGATGFVGKQIIEKLLRSCSGINHIYILIRSKRGINITDRINQLFSSPLFDKIRLSTPNFESKIIPIIGDLTKINFDLNDEDEKLLINNCHIVINSGASVRFTDPLKQAIKSNVLSVQTIINLCKKMKQLQSCIHISTAYVHCYRTDINEIIYPTNENPNVLLEALEWFDEKIFDHLSKKLLEKFPNTYTYTKSLAEYLILQYAKDLPIAIIRPSIIGAAWQEPIPGWIDSYSGVTNVIVTIGKRLLRVVFSNSLVDHPMIPVDTVANMTITIAWYTAINKNLSSIPSVYNCCTGTNNKTCLVLKIFVCISNFIVVSIENLDDMFLVRTIITEQKSIQFENYKFIEPHVTLTSNRVYYAFRRLCGEIIPTYLMDLIACLTFRKANMVKLDKKINNLIRSMDYFSRHQWIFPNENSQILQNQMTNFDRQEFNFDITKMNWSSYIRNYSIGVKKYLLKEPLQQSSISKSSNRLFGKNKIQYFLSMIIFLIITWLIRRIFRRKLQ